MQCRRQQPDRQLITCIGYNADVSGVALTNATALGNGATVNASNKVRIGNAAVSVIEGQVAWSYPSDGRFKLNVTEEVKGLDFIKLLRPVVYNFDTRKYTEFLTQNMPDSCKERIPEKRFRTIHCHAAERLHCAGSC